MHLAAHDPADLLGPIPSYLTLEAAGYTVTHLASFIYVLHMPGGRLVYSYLEDALWAVARRDWRAREIDRG